MFYSTQNKISNFHKPEFLLKEEHHNTLKPQEKRINQVVQESKALEAQFQEVKGKIASMYQRESEQMDKVADVLEKMDEITALFKKGENRTSPGHSGPITSVLEEMKSFKKEIDDQVRSVQEKIKPEVQKAQNFIGSLKKLDQLIEERFKGKEKPPEIVSFKRQVQMEVEKYEKELEVCYQTGLKLTQVERTTLINSINAAVGNDKVTKSKVQMIKRLYDMGHFLKLTPEEIHEEVQAAFELNDMKNEFFDGVAKLIKDPKQVIVKELKKLNE